MGNQIAAGDSDGLGVRLSAGAGVGEVTGTGAGLLASTSISLVSFTIRVLELLLYEPIARILLPTRLSIFTVSGTSSVMVSEAVVIKKYFLVASEY